MAPRLIGPSLLKYLACAQSALATPVGKAFVAPGLQVPWDDCCEGSGQLWVRLVSVAPAPATAQQRNAAGRPCSVPWWVATFAVGVLRCVPTVDSDGRFPTAEDITASALRISEDAEDLQDAIMCCMEPYAPITWSPLGPEGGCAGGEWQFQVRLPDCACEPVVSEPPD